jgi:hypothetical protein
MALVAINAATTMLQDTDTAPEERHVAGVMLALELVSDETPGASTVTDEDLVGSS